MHVFAINRDGGLIPASEAKSGIVYHCPICNCEMYRTSRKGTDYYACMPGYVHSHPVCQKVDRNKTARITGLTHRDVFHAWLMTQPRPAGGPGPGPGPGPRPGPGGSVVKALPYRSLEDLYNNGLHRCDDIPIADGMLSDLIISSHTTHMVMCDNDDIGPRVIQAIPDDCYDDKRSIRFVLCGRVGDMNCRKVFDVFFKDNDEYIEWAGKLFINTIENGKTDKTSRYRFVLIHGEWNAMPIDACQTCCNKQCDGKWICTGYQYSYYCSSRQILCPKDQQIIK